MAKQTFTNRMIIMVNETTGTQILNHMAPLAECFCNYHLIAITIFIPHTERMRSIQATQCVFNWVAW